MMRHEVERRLWWAPKSVACDEAFAKAIRVDSEGKGRDLRAGGAAADILRITMWRSCCGGRT